MEISTGKVDRASVCQMSAVIQVHTHHSVTRLKQCKLYCHICLCSGMWLYIGIGASKQFFGTVNGKLLYLIYTLASSIITFSRISFCIFICHDASLCFHNCITDPVLGCDQLDMAVLTVHLRFDRCCHVCINYF